MSLTQLRDRAQIQGVEPTMLMKSAHCQQTSAARRGERIPLQRLYSHYAGIFAGSDSEIVLAEPQEIEDVFPSCDLTFGGQCVCIHTWTAGLSFQS